MTQIVWVVTEYGWDTATVVGVYVSEELANRAVASSTPTGEEGAQRSLGVEPHEVRTSIETRL